MNSKQNKNQLLSGWFPTETSQETMKTKRQQLGECFIHAWILDWDCFRLSCRSSLKSYSNDCHEPTRTSLASALLHSLVSPSDNESQLKPKNIFSFLEIYAFNFANESIEKDFEFVQKVAKALRSARSDYNIPAKTKTEAFIISSDEKLSSILNNFKTDLQTLSYCSSSDVVEKARSGCTILTINAQCEVHLMLKGIIEVDKEIGKLEKKREQLQLAISKLKQKMSIENYETKVPLNVQEDNTENLKQSEIEVVRIGSAIEALKLM